MATRKQVQKATTETPDRFKLGESGFIGLNIFSGVSNDELKRELNFPNNIKIYKEMSYHSAVNSSLTLFDNIISKATWTFKPPANATEEEKRQCEIVNTMMQDMEHSWAEFIRDILSMNIYGFSVHEKRAPKCPVSWRWQLSAPRQGFVPIRRSPRGWPLLPLVWASFLAKHAGGLGTARPMSPQGRSLCLSVCLRSQSHVVTKRARRGAQAPVSRLAHANA